MREIARQPFHTACPMTAGDHVAAAINQPQGNAMRAMKSAPPQGHLGLLTQLPLPCVTVVNNGQTRCHWST